MISESQLLKVTKQARIDAVAFIKHCELYDQDVLSVCEDPQRFSAELTKFVAQYRGAYTKKLLRKDTNNHKDIIVVPLNKLPEAHFSSWLFLSAEDEINIVLDLEMMRSWSQTSGLPFAIQRIRSIIHELGHIIFSTHLIFNAKAGSFMPKATAKEEEVAWVYTFAFLACLVGDYSLTVRASRDTDETPKLPL